jgi:hypothetical protein
MHRTKLQVSVDSGELDNEFKKTLHRLAEQAPNPETRLKFTVAHEQAHLLYAIDKEKK